MVQIPREIYTLGAVQFDASKLANLQGQLLAKKAAKEEALNKYFSDLQNKINTAGVRTQDLQNEFGGINKDIEDWRKNWITNREAISQGGMAQQEHLAKYQNILRKIDQSKGRAKTDLTLAEMKVKGEYDPDEDDLHVQQKISYPIQDPRSYKEDGITEYGIGDLSYNVKSWDIPKRKQFIDFAIGGMKPVGKANIKTIEDPESFTKKKTWDVVFTDDQIKSASKKAIAITADKSALKTYNNILKEGEKKFPFIPSDEFRELANVYHSAHPDDLMDTPVKVAEADIMLNMAGAKDEGKETISDVKGRMQYGSELTEGRTQRRMDRLLTGNVIDNFPDTEISRGKEKKGFVKSGVVYDGKGGFYTGEFNTSYQQLPADLPAVLKFAKVSLNRTKPIKVNVKNGVIQSIQQEGSPVIARQFIENAQRKFGKGMTFGQTEGSMSFDFEGVPEGGF